MEVITDENGDNDRALRVYTGRDYFFANQKKEENMNDLTRYKLTAGLPVPSAAKLIYCYLLDVSDRRGIAISVRQLGKSIGLSRSATRKNLHRLKHMDMLDISPRYSEDGGRLSNQYKLK